MIKPILESYINSVDRIQSNTETTLERKKTKEYNSETTGMRKLRRYNPVKNKVGAHTKENSG